MGMESFNQGPESEHLDQKNEQEKLQDENKPEKRGLISSLVGKFQEARENRAQWKRVEELARENGYTLRLVSEKEYHKRRRPLPHGGALYIWDENLKVRYEQVSPERVIAFINELKERKPKAK